MKDYLSLYEQCTLCPRCCGVNRLRDEFGFCRSGSRLRAAAAVLHKGEEPGITGPGGSGTIFFSGCTLGCSFCQNYQVSREGSGGLVTLEELTEMVLSLQNRGAENINLVTGTHFVPTILEAVRGAKTRGLKIPVVWNSSGFETEETVTMLSREIDIFLPDCKTLSEKASLFLFQTPSYPGNALKSIELMARLKPEVSVIRGVITAGVIVRHLVLPSYLDETKRVIDWFQKELKNRCYFSLLGQYTPVPSSPAGNLSRRLTRDEYEEAVDYLLKSIIEEGYIQDFSDDSGWLPDFREENPFPSSQSITLWSGGR